MNAQDNPLVSVVVPVYNCAAYLRECLDSIVRQTYDSWELICIDDGSQDDSPAILNEYVDAWDEKIRVVSQENLGPAAARNTGIAMAQGAYILFVDADDFIEPNLLEYAVARALDTNAEIVVWDVWYFAERIGRRQEPPEGIVSSASYGGGSPLFSWRDNPDAILLDFQNWPWNKLFNTAFVRKHNFKFQEEVMRTEDVMFVCAALVKAQRIAYLDMRLSNYRVGRHDSAMANKDPYALDFLTVLLTFKDYLAQEGLFEPLERSYATWAASSALYNLRTLNTYGAYERAYNALQQQGLSSMGVVGHAEDYYVWPWLADAVDEVLAKSPQRYAFDNWKALEYKNEEETLRAEFAQDKA